MKCLCGNKMYVVSETKYKTFLIKEHRCMECGRTVKEEVNVAING